MVFWWHIKYLIHTETYVLAVKAEQRLKMTKGNSEMHMPGTGWARYKSLKCSELAIV